MKINQMCQRMVRSNPEHSFDGYRQHFPKNPDHICATLSSAHLSLLYFPRILILLPGLLPVIGLLFIL